MQEVEFETEVEEETICMLGAASAGKAAGVWCTTIRTASSKGLPATVRATSEYRKWK
jgi:hypothetical protein